MGPPPYLGMVRARNFQFDRQSDYEAFLQNEIKIRSKRVM